MERPGLPEGATWYLCLPVASRTWSTPFPSDNLLALSPCPKQCKHWGYLLTILSAKQGSSASEKSVGRPLALTQKSRLVPMRAKSGVWGGRTWTSRVLAAKIGFSFRS